MIFLRSFAFLLLIFIFAFPAAGEIRKAERLADRISAAQVFVLSDVYKDDLGAFFSEAKAKGIDTVFFRVFHNAGDRPHMGADLACQTGVYFKTSGACVVRDMLGDVVREAHMRGIKVFAWMATRSLSFLKTPENMSMSFAPEGGIIPGYGANIFKPEVRLQLIRLFKDLAKYDIDGILFQDDFIIKYSEGADKQSADLFFAETGFKADPAFFFEGVRASGDKTVFSGLTDGFYIWARWKNDHLMKFFKELRHAVLEENPDILFAANVYYETPVAPRQALAWYSQRLEALEKAGADYYAVMGYAEQISAEQKLDAEDTADLIAKISEEAVAYVKDPKRVIMKLQSRLFAGDKREVSGRDFKRLCQAVAIGGEVSVAVVPVFSGNDIKTCFPGKP